ncbi:hypothetical protein EDB92DRAFT_1814297 [Lactarius akahatsu]|uniref:Secreted protein n=1 Tax=Lactarius akahatsu TaxID=416441 RepID=A0AAD4QFY6_9AGAM|nr:hypothetical protein EDB92DRAFT_1814297 [Lactarius akahatsu]
MATSPLLSGPLLSLLPPSTFALCLPATLACECGTQTHPAGNGINETHKSLHPTHAKGVHAHGVVQDKEQNGTRAAWLHAPDYQALSGERSDVSPLWTGERVNRRKTWTTGTRKWVCLLVCPPTPLIVCVI